MAEPGTTTRSDSTKTQSPHRSSTRTKTTHRSSFSASDLTVSNIAILAGKELPFDGMRGTKNMGGWWIDLEEAKELALGQEWWTEREQKDSKPVAIPDASAKSSEVEQPTSSRPVWFYNDGTMYLGSWTESRNGAGSRIMRVEQGLGISCKADGECYVGAFQNGVFHGWGRSFWLDNSPAWRNNVNFKEKQICVLKATGWVGLPYEYHGKFVNNNKQCLAGTVTLKDKTRRNGVWSQGMAVLVLPKGPPKHSRELTIKANWWTDHFACDGIEVDSPDSRRDAHVNNKKRKVSSNAEEIHGGADSSSSSSSSSSSQNQTHNKQIPSQDQIICLCGESVDDNDNDDDDDNVNDDDDDDDGVKADPSSSAEESNNLCRTQSETSQSEDNIPMRVESSNGGTEGNDDPSSNVEDSSSTSSQNQSWSQEDIPSRVEFTDGGAVADNVPSSNMEGSNTEDSNTDDSHTEDSSESTCLYPDACLSKSEEIKLPLHAAVKFGDQDLVDEEVAKLAAQHDSTENNNNNNNNNNNAKDEQLSINALDSKGRTALDLAALTGQLDLVAKLRGVAGSKFVKMSGPRMMIIARYRSKTVDDYLKQVQSEFMDEYLQREV